jgi:hypothetical protein
MKRRILFVVSTLFLLIGAGLLTMAGLRAAAFRISVTDGIAISGALVLVTAFVSTLVAGISFAAAFKDNGSGQSDSPSFALCILLLIVLSILLLSSVAPRAFLLGLFGVAALAAVQGLMQRLGDEPIELQTTWGGLGGGLGGWRLSGTAVLLIIALSFGASAIGVGLSLLPGGAAEEAVTERSLTFTLRTTTPKLPPKMEVPSPAPDAAAPTSK